MNFRACRQYTLIAVVLLLLVSAMVCLWRQPITDERLSFKAGLPDFCR
jgi:hypothetical protein